ncbi:hypothetical protein KEM55_006893, partial [Ascosphaera atra]
MASSLSPSSASPPPEPGSFSTTTTTTTTTTVATTAAAPNSTISSPFTTPASYPNYPHDHFVSPTNPGPRTLLSMPILWPALSQEYHATIYSCPAKQCSNIAVYLPLELCREIGGCDKWDRRYGGSHNHVGDVYVKNGPEVAPANPTPRILSVEQQLRLLGAATGEENDGDEEEQSWKDAVKQIPDGSKQPTARQHQSQVSRIVLEGYAHLSEHAAAQAQAQAQAHTSPSSAPSGTPSRSLPPSSIHPHSHPHWIFHEYTSSPDTPSPVFPDRLIRPMPKRSKSSRLSPEVKHKIIGMLSKDDQRSGRDLEKEINNSRSLSEGHDGNTE